ncbi:MAG: histidine phosphatase family protein [Bdellovibrionales bacterium]|nr:histidine phosphatase family protein [Bdellovibrionales bacterium]
MSKASAVAVFLFRHGETDWNFERRWQGHSDIPLNATGLEQAAQLAKDLERFKIQQIISSDLLRAKKTGQIVANAFGIPIHFDARLRETHLGMAEGMTNDEVIKAFGQPTWDRWARFEESDPLASFPNGESKPAVLKRVLLALQDHLTSTKHQVVGISTHGGVLRRVIHSVRPELTEPVIVPNCMAFQMEFDQKTQKLKWIADHPPSTHTKAGPF